MPDPAKQPLWMFDCNSGNRFAKRQEVNSAAISDDGNLVVAGTFFHDYSMGKHAPRSLAQSDFFLYCFARDQADPSTPKPKFAWKHQSQEGFYWVDISGDGAFVAGGGSNFVVAFRTSDGAKVLDAKTQTRVSQLVLSHDGGVLAVAAEKLIVLRYDGTQYINAGDDFETPNAVYSVSMSADGTRLAFSDYGPSETGRSKPGIFYFDRTEDIRTFTDTEAYSHSVRIDRAGRYFASGGGYSPGGMSNVATMFETSAFVMRGARQWTRQMPGIVYNIFVDEMGRVAAVSNAGPDAGVVMLWDQSGNLLWQVQVERNPNSTTISGHYVTVATGHPNGTPGFFYLLDIESGETLWRYAVPSDMNWPMTISRDGTGIIAGSDNQQVFYFQP